MLTRVNLYNVFLLEIHLEYFHVIHIEIKLRIWKYFYNNHHKNIVILWAYCKEILKPVRLCNMYWRSWCDKPSAHRSTVCKNMSISFDRRVRDIHSSLVCNKCCEQILWVFHSTQWCFSTIDVTSVFLL